MLARRTGVLGAVAPLTAMVLLVVSPAGAVPPFTATVYLAHPSFASRGGVAVNSSLVLFLSGNGSTTVPGTPDFHLGNGNAGAGIVAEVRGGPGVAEISAKVGVGSLSFVCPTVCRTTGLAAVVAWNLTDYLSVLNNCAPGKGDGWASLVMDATLVDATAGSGSHLAGSGTRTIWHLRFNGSGSWGASEAGQAVRLRFPVNLTAGHTYTFESYLAERAFAASPGCLVRTTASIGYHGTFGSPGNTYLDRVAIG